jgi:hypothetical protein
MIQRTVRKASIGPGRVRYRVIITGDDCPFQTHESRIHQNLFLHWLADNQAMLACGYSVPDSIRVSHNGTAWQAECEAEVDEATT